MDTSAPHSDPGELRECTASIYFVLRVVERLPGAVIQRSALADAELSIGALESLSIEDLRRIVDQVRSLVAEQGVEAIEQQLLESLLGPPGGPEPDRTFNEQTQAPDGSVGGFFTDGQTPKSMEEIRCVQEEAARQGLYLASGVKYNCCGILVWRRFDA